jgi:hypothetical protein
MVSFEDFRKSLVNGVALPSNSLVRLLTSEKLKLESESLNFNAPVGTSTLRSFRVPASLIAQSARLTRFCLCEFSVMLRDIDEASLHVAVRFKACAV